MQDDLFPEDDLYQANVLSDEDIKAGVKIAAAEVKRVYEEPCRTCRGSKRHCNGPCYRCRGRGYERFSTSPEQRDASRRAAAEKRMDKDRAIVEAARQWATDNPEDFAWIQAQKDRFEFALDMNTALHKYGALTERQHAAIVRMRERDAERKQSMQKKHDEAPVLTLAAIEVAFANARAAGLQKPVLRLAGYRFSPAPMTGSNPGAIYVKDIKTDAYLGKIVNSKFLAVRICSPAVEADVVMVCNDPMNHAIAYGKKFGSCACCGRELTVKESIERGIGPVCAERYGW